MCLNIHVELTLSEFLLIISPYFVVASIVFWSITFIIKRFVGKGNQKGKSLEEIESELYLRDTIISENLVIKWSRRTAWLLIIAAMVVLIHFIKAGGPNKGQVLVVGNNRYFELQASLLLLVFGLAVAELTTQIIKKKVRSRQNQHANTGSESVYPIPTRQQ